MPGEQAPKQAVHILLSQDHLSKGSSVCGEVLSSTYHPDT